MHTTRRTTRLTLALLACGAALSSTAGAAVAPRTALLDAGTTTEFDQVNTSAGTLTLDAGRTYQGAGAAKASVSGGGANAFSRGLFNVDWPVGSDVWYGGAYYLPAGFKTAMQGQVDLLRWDNWPTDPTNTDRSGVVIYGSDKRARLVRQRLGVEQAELGAAFDLPEGRWFWLEVHQRLSAGDGSALSEVFIDGVRVVTSTARNSYGRAAQRIRYGIVAVAAGKQVNPLQLWFDRALVRTAAAGPLPAAAEPAPATEPVSRPRKRKASAASARKAAAKTRARKRNKRGRLKSSARRTR